MFEKIERWATDRGLETADPAKQLVKLMEESGELAEGFVKGRPDLVKDAVGDIVVVLTVFCLQSGYSIEDCINGAYEEIKDRTGRMINGVYVKNV